MSITKKSGFAKKLKDCQSIVRYLSLYPEAMQQMGINELLKPEDLEQNYIEWKQLVAKYKGLEKDHFKDYWLPIEADNFQFFIDLLSNDYNIIESIYINGDMDSEEYISSNLFFTASEFFEIIDDHDELEEHFDRHLMHRYFKYPDSAEIIDLGDFDFFD